VVGKGAAVLSREGRLIAANATVRSYFGCFSFSSNGSFSLLDRASHRALQGLLVRDAVEQLSPMHAPLSGPALLRISEGSALVAYALGSPGSEDQVLVILLDPYDRREPTPLLLKQMFGLTSAEAKVAMQLARGWGIKGIASALSVSEGTIRAQLKSILAKTNTHRQADLVGLLVRIAQANLMPEHRTRAGLEPNVSGR
jgi:DNA-binding CsgD family transcriptional regulator